MSLDSLYYHYTDDEGAKSILRSGKILASLEFMQNGDAGFGNGVYLTKLEPETSTKSEIALNNWMKTGPPFIKKTQNYFVIKIPDCDVKDVSANGRKIFLLNGRNDLFLRKYSWWLRNHDTQQIIVSYKYQLASLGPALSAHGDKMGNYIMSEDAANGRPVYKHETSSYCLFMGSRGDWYVHSDTGEDKGWFGQLGEYALGPDTNVPWKYFTDGKWKKDDVTLKAHAWQS